MKITQFIESHEFETKNIPVELWEPMFRTNSKTFKVGHRTFEPGSLLCVNITANTSDAWETARIVYEFIPMVCVVPALRDTYKAFDFSFLSK